MERGLGVVVTGNRRPLLAAFPALAAASVAGAMFGQLVCLGSTTNVCRAALNCDPLTLDRTHCCAQASGFGAGVLWGWWYQYLEATLAEHGIQPGVTSTVVSLTSEQFLWAPIFFGVYFLPLTGLLKGKDAEGIVQEVKEEIIPTLWANAQVWTFLNIIIYNVPLPVRPFVSNLGDICWSAYLSFIVQSDHAEDKPVISETAAIEAASLESLVEQDQVSSQVVPFKSPAVLQPEKVLVGDRESDTYR